MSLTLIKIAIKDPADTDQVILSNIMDGVDGAVAMGWSQEQQEVAIEDNQRVDHTTQGTLELKVMKGSSADVTTLNGFIGKKCEVSAWTLGGFLLFKETIYPSRVPDFNSSLLNDLIRATISAPKGFRGTGSQSQAFYGGANALMLYNMRSSSGATNSQLLSGFTKEGTPNTNVTGIKQTVDGANGEGVKSALLYFPFEGATLTASAQISSTPADGELGLRFLQANGTTVVSTSTTSFTTGGRRSHTVTVPENAAYMQFIALLEEEGSFEFELPAIKTTNSLFEE